MERRVSVSHMIVASSFFRVYLLFSSVAESLPVFPSSREDLARASKTLIVTRREGGKAGPGSL